MEAFNTLTSIVVPLLLPNIDTDIITPMNRLVGRQTKPLWDYAFEPLRYVNGNAETGEPDPLFPLNQTKFTGARIMLTGENFGCGSSRESAPAALVGLGIRCLIGTSFGDIFFNNCFQQGILPIRVKAETFERFLDEAGDGEFIIRLDRQSVTTPCGDTHRFEVNPLRKLSLLEGLDDIGLTLKREADISVFQDGDRQSRPWIYQVSLRRDKLPV